MNTELFNSLVTVLKNGMTVDGGEDLAIFPLVATEADPQRYVVDYALSVESTNKKFEEEDGAAETFLTPEEAVKFFLEKKAEGY